MLDAAFLPTLWTLAIEHRTRPEILLLTWWAESGLDPRAKNKGGCIGLNQSCPRPDGPGFPTADPEEYRGWPASRQLSWIGPQLAAAIALNGGPFESAARYWQGNILPASLQSAVRPLDVVMAREGPYARAYEANKGLDYGQDRRVTLEDIGDTMADALVRKKGEGFLRALVERAYHERPEEVLWSEPLALWDAVYEPGSTRHVPAAGGGRAPAPRGRGAGAAFGLVAVALLGVGVLARRRAA
jgi:hypothetical protein